MRFIPLASDTSTGAMDPRKRDGMNEDTREIRAVRRYASGLMRRIYACMRQSVSIWQTFGIAEAGEAKVVMEMRGN